MNGTHIMLHLLVHCDCLCAKKMNECAVNIRALLKGIQTGAMKCDHVKNAKQLDRCVEDDKDHCLNNLLQCETADVQRHLKAL